MNILHLNDYYSCGGAEVVYRNTYMSMQHKDTHNVHYCGFHNDKNKDILSDIEFSKKSRLSYFFSINNFRSMIEFLEKRDIDIIHIHNFSTALSPAIFLAIKKYRKKKRNLKVIHTVHDFYILCPEKSMYDHNKGIICNKCIGKKIKLKNILMNKCDRRGLIYSIAKGINWEVSKNIINYDKAIDLFIVPSEFLKDKLIEEGLDKQKIRVISNPVDSNFLDRDNYINLQEKQNIICYFGRFNKEKNVNMLIEAFSKISDNKYKLLLIGSGEEEKNYRELISKLGIETKVNIMPFLEHNDLVKVLSKCKISVIPSKWYETYGLTLFESIECRLIPIVSDIGALKENIDIIKFGVKFNNDNLKSLIDSINYTIENIETEQSKIENAKKYIKDKLNLDIYIETILSIYKEY